MITRSSVGNDAPLSALARRHLEGVFGAEPVPPAAIETCGRDDQWFGALPRPVDLSREGASLAVDFQALSPSLRARLLALALQGEAAVPYPERIEVARASGFIGIAERDRIRWMSDLHRAAVLSASRPEDHLTASRVRPFEPSGPNGRALHLVYAGEPVSSAELVAASGFFASANRPSLAVYCLVVAAESAPSPTTAATAGAAAANIAACEGDFDVVDRVMERFAAADAAVLFREAAPARALRQAVVENDQDAARGTIRSRLREEGLDQDARGEALAVYALVNVLSGDLDAWGDFVSSCAAASAPLHPAIVAIAATIGSPNSTSEPLLAVPAATDGRGWAQLAGCVATILYAYRGMRLGSFSPWAVLEGRGGNRLVRAVEATQVSMMLAHNQYWDEFERAVTVALELTTDTVRSPLIRVGAEAALAFADAFRGERVAARRRVERLVTEPVVRRTHRVRSILTSVVALCEGQTGNYEQALALLATRQPDILDLTVGPCGPMELFDFVDYAFMTQQEEQAELRVEQFREALHSLRSQRADFVIAACEAVIAARHTLKPIEDLLLQGESLPFVYESARLRLVYGERLRRARRVADARRHLLRVEFDLASVQAGAWSDRVQRELRACHKEVVVGTADLTEQEMRIAELAAGGLSNKQIGARLFLSPRTVGGHLYKIFPKLGVTTRAQLRDALTVSAETGERSRPEQQRESRETR